MPPKVIGQEGQGWQEIGRSKYQPGCYGQYLLNPQFGGTGNSLKDLEGLMERAKLLSQYEEGNIVATYGGGDGEPASAAALMPERKSIWRVAQNGRRMDTPEFVPIQDASSIYTLYNHDDMVARLVDHLREHEVHFRGEIHETGAQMRGRLILEDPNYTVPLLTLHEDYVKLVIQFQNSVDGSLKWGGLGAGIRMICCNYNMWGDLLGSVFGKHTGRVEVKFNGLVSMIMKAGERLAQVGDTAWNDTIDPSQIVEFMTGVRIPDPVIHDVVENLTHLEPLIQNETSFNRYTIYNAVTAWVSAAKLPDQRAEDLLQRAEVILMDKTDDIIKRGERIMEERKEREERQNRREQLLRAVNP